MDTQKNSSSEQATEKQTQKRKGVSDYIEILAGWIVDIISIPVSFALFFWIFDLTTTFVGRNPFAFTNPSTILACLVYNLGSMMAGEIGYTIWKLTK